VIGIPPRRLPYPRELARHDARRRRRRQHADRCPELARRRDHLCGESLATTRPLAREQALANPVRWRMFFDRGLERARVVPPRCDVRVDLAAIVENIRNDRIDRGEIQRGILLCDLFGPCGHRAPGRALAT
jgi:hypothetical protein